MTNDDIEVQKIVTDMIEKTQQDIRNLQVRLATLVEIRSNIRSKKPVSSKTDIQQKIV